MKAIKRVNQKAVKLMNKVALLAVIESANKTCAWVFHQPEFPEEANKFQKLKK